MILRTRDGNRELRFSGQSFIPTPWAGLNASSGVAVTTSTATGLPAFGRAIRLVGGLIGASSICVYSGKRGKKVELESDPLAMLFDNPYPGTSAFSWRYDIAVSLEARENAFIRKIKSRVGKVVALEVLPPRFVDAYLDSSGTKRFRISTANGWVEVPASEILHIRGHTVDGGPFGVSRITQHCDPIGAQLAAQRFEGAFFRNNARPDFVLEFQQGVTKEQAKQWKDEWDSAMAGPDNAGQARAIGGGGTVKEISVSMQDAQFIQSRQLGVSDAARIMDVEELLLGGGQQEQQDDQAMDRFLAFQMPPRLSRITDALKADPDLFPNANPYPEFASSPLMFASPKTRADVQHSEIQAGTLLPDEARADNGRPPLPDGLGQIPQVTPVGGAPNPAPPAAPAVEEKSKRELVVVNMPADDMTAELRQSIRELAETQRTQQPPVVNNHIHPPTIEVDARHTTNMPEQPAPVVNITERDVTVNLPEQPAPVVNVEVEGATINLEEREQPAPVVNLTVDPAPIVVEARAAEQPAPVVNIHVDPTPVTIDAPVTVNVPEAAPPIVVTGGDKKIQVKRDPKTNLIESATVEEQ